MSRISEMYLNKLPASIVFFSTYAAEKMRKALVHWSMSTIYFLEELNSEIMGCPADFLRVTMTYNIYNTPVPHNTDSDEPDDEEMSPMGSFWPTPEDEEWKMVERSHGSLRGTTDIGSDRLHKSGDQLDHSGMRCGQLDYIEETDNRSTRPEVLLSKWKEGDTVR